LVNPGPLYARNIDAMRDGEHFVTVDDFAQDDSGESTASRIHVVLNWQEELKERVPAR